MFFLVFAHCAGEMVEYELDRASYYGVPVIAVIDPARVAEKYRKARSKKISDCAVAEVNLDSPADIVIAIRTHARKQATTQPAVSVVESDEAAPAVEDIATPRDIAKRMSVEVKRPSFLRRLGSFFLGKSFRADGAAPRPD